MVKHRIVFTAAALAAAVSLLSCSDSGGTLDEEGKAKVQKYFSADDPGKWVDQAVDHDLKVSIIEDAKGKKGIEVFVPFTSGMNEQHYVEAMALTDENGKQLEAVRFKRGEKAAAIFTVTDKMKFPMYVVAKCNMHDMWRKKVAGTEKEKTE